MAGEASTEGAREARPCQPTLTRPPTSLRTLSPSGLQTRLFFFVKWWGVLHRDRQVQQRHDLAHAGAGDGVEAVAVLYHVLYATVFLAVGVGLLTGRRWGYWLVFAATLYYTLDRLLCPLDRKTMEVHLAQQLEPYREILEYIDRMPCCR